MDSEVAQIRSEVVQLRSEVGQVDSKVGRLGAEVGQLGSELALMQTDVQKNDASLVDLAIRVNQLDRRMARGDQPSAENGERASRTPEAAGRQPNPPVAPASLSSQRADTAKALKHGMSQRDVLRLFGNPHGIEKVVDSVYWYYGDGELKGEYIRFDARSGQVNGWSIFSPQNFQLDLRTTQGGHVR
jgi:hypothetical protein